MVFKDKYSFGIILPMHMRLTLVTGYYDCDINDPKTMFTAWFDGVESQPYGINDKGQTIIAIDVFDILDTKKLTEKELLALNLKKDQLGKIDQFILQYGYQLVEKYDF
jgi:hypothetical protein